MNSNKNPMTELNGADVYANWDSLVSTDKKNAEPQQNFDLSVDNLIADNGEEKWLKEFQKTNLPGMSLVALKLLPTHAQPFKKTRAILAEQIRTFLLTLPIHHMTDLRVAGLSEDQIANISGGILPINWTIHLKYPLAYGGDVTADNFVLIPHHPFHEEIHRFLNQQLLTDAGVITPRVLYVPVVEGAVYVPFANTEMATEVKHIKLSGGPK
ncbi:MAG: hypothetical protein II942_00135 [Alphaproteobacteria bacterium]|nr:hypothetical protein [Alphaproteobacteria bacterium]